VRRDEGKNRRLQHGSHHPILASEKLLFTGSFAYSVHTALPDGTISCLLETADANSILFARFTGAWLTDQKDQLGDAK